jgi:putative acetyltransferase
VSIPRGSKPPPDVIVLRVSAHEPGLDRLIRLSDEYMATLYPPDSNYLESLAALAEPNVALFGGYAGGDLAACVAVKLLSEDLPFAEVKRLFVVAEHRGKGLAKLLMRHVESYVTDVGVSVVRLETGVEQPEALGLYESLGYSLRPPFGVHGTDPLSVFMEKRLSPF